ncbi:MAG: translocation/assembly module TamB domain-containing protein, partial [Planctomycetota bacterium]
MEHEARQDPRAVTATAGGSQGEPGAAPAPDRPPRRRRRWWRWILLSLAVLAAGGAGGGYILRTQVLAEVIARTLPEVLALKLGTPVALGGIGVLEGSAADAGLSITFSSLDVGAGDPQAPLHLRLEGGRVRFHGWWALLRGIDGIAGVDIARAVVHHRVEPGASSEDGKIPDPVLPAALPEIPFPVVIGRLELSSGSRSLAGALEAAAGRVLLEAREIEGVAGLESARVEAFLAAGGIPRLAARVEPGAMKLEGRLHPAEGGWQGALDLETPLVRGALELALPGAPGGTATLDATIEDLEGLASDLGIEGAQASRSPIAELHLSLGGGRYRITGACSTAEGTLRIAGGGDARELSLRVLTDDFNVGELLRRIRGVPAELEPRALTSGEIRLRGPYSDLRGDAELRLHDGTVRLAGEQLPLGNTVLLASLHDGRLAIDEIRTDAFGGDLEATGGIPLEEGQEWQMAFTYHDLEVARLRPWAPALRALSGRVEGRGEIIGARDAPRLFTEGWLKGGELAPGSWERLTEIEGRFELRPERLEVTGISARLGGGTVTGSGELLLGAPVERGDGIAEGETFRTTLHLDRVRLFRSTDMLARGSGDLTLRGTPAEPQLSGSVEIVRGIYHRNVYPSLEGGDGLPFD